MIKIEFSTDNAAFQDNFMKELDYILFQIKDVIKRRIGAFSYLGEFTILDSNGNKVGKIQVNS